MHDDDGACLAPGAGLDVRQGGPLQGCSVRVGRIGGCQGDCGADLSVLHAFADVTQPVHGGRGGELGRAELLDEVAATHLPCGLCCREHFVHAGEAAGHVLRGDGASGEDAVPVQKDFGSSMRRGGDCGGVVGLRLGDEGPPPSGGRAAGGARARLLRVRSAPQGHAAGRVASPGGGGLPLVSGAAAAEPRPDGSEAVGCCTAGPEQLPERVLGGRDRELRGASDRLGEPCTPRSRTSITCWCTSASCSPRLRCSNASASAVGVMLIQPSCPASSPCPVTTASPALSSSSSIDGV